jgi:hypothetical protein
MLIGRSDRSKAGPPERPGVVSEQRVAAAPNAAQSDGVVAVLAAWFDAGASRSPFHEALHVMEGVGIVATETKKRIIRAGIP